jgi:hypothetical protein
VNKCRRISWKGHDVGRRVGDSLFPLPVAVFVFSIAKTFILPYIETKNLWSRVPHEKLRFAQQVIILYRS